MHVQMVNSYRGADKSLARPSCFIYISSTNIPPIMIINKIYEHQNLLSLQLVSFLFGLRTYQHPCTTLIIGGADKSLTRPTSRCILFDGENIFLMLVLLYINSTNIPPIMIINRIYETQNLLSLQLVSFLVGLRTYQHSCTELCVMTYCPHCYVTNAIQRGLGLLF